MNFTAAASNGVSSVNTRSGRISIVHVEKSSSGVTDSANRGVIVPSGSIRTNESYTAYGWPCEIDPPPLIIFGS